MKQKIKKVSLKNQVKGSVDAQLPYITVVIHHVLQCVHVIILYSGTQEH